MAVRFVTFWLLVFVCMASGCKKDDEEVLQPAVEKAAQEKVTEEKVAEAKVAEEKGRAARRGLAAIPGTGTKTVVEKVRQAVLAGSWYDEDREVLGGRVDGWMEQTSGEKLDGYPIALVVPHAGHRWSGPTAAYGYRQLAGRTYGRVFVLGPSHHERFHGVSLPECTHYETPLGKVPVDVALVDELASGPLFSHNPRVHLQEHSLEIQLPFLQRVLGDFTLVPMLVSGVTAQEVEQIATVLRQVVRPGDLLIASSDFTHYGRRFGYLGPPGATFTASQAPERLESMLQQAWEAIATGDETRVLAWQRETGDTICGILPIAIVLAALPDDMRPHLLKTDFSARQAGDWDGSVSYLSAAFTGLWPYAGVAGEGALTSEEKQDLLRLARETVDTWVSEGKRPSVESLGITVTAAMRENSGAFVTLKKGEQLRGCIGTIPPVKPLLDAVRDNAVNAAHFDRRFPKVTQEELRAISVEVSVLTPPVAVEDWRDIILARHGVIVSKAGRSAVFLPQVAPEQGWTLEETLSHLSAKAGLGPSAWREGAEFLVFEATVFHEN